MPRGTDQKIFFPIRPEHEDYDRGRIANYLNTLKSGKENKGAVFLTQEGKQGELKGMFIVLMEKADKQKALDKGYAER